MGDLLSEAAGGGDAVAVDVVVVAVAFASCSSSSLMRSSRRCVYDSVGFLQTCQPQCRDL